MPDTKETFPRGPSNEQTLLTELGQVKAQRDFLSNVAVKSAGQLVTLAQELEQAKAERDALAVTAEQYNEGIDNWIKRSYAQDEQILGLQAERDTARSEVKRLTEIITGWRAEYDHKENVTREQIARLRESLEWAFGETNRDENYFLNGSKVAAVCAILKETAP